MALHSCIFHTLFLKSCKSKRLFLGRLAHTQTSFIESFVHFISCYTIKHAKIMMYMTLQYFVFPISAFWESTNWSASCKKLCPQLVVSYLVCSIHFCVFLKNKEKFHRCIISYRTITCEDHKNMTICWHCKSRCLIACPLY
jgi:hypothetical protein